MRRLLVGRRQTTLQSRRIGDDTAFSDPLADLMFTMIAIILLLLIALAPKMIAGGRQSLPHLILEDREAAVILATRSGAQFEDDNTVSVDVDQTGPRPHHAIHIAVDDIVDDRKIASFLEEARGANRPVAVLIETGGLEAAFQIQSALSSAGLKEFYELRLDRDCEAPTLGRAECFDLK